MHGVSPSLAGEPFEPAVFFESRAHRRAMAYLGYGLALAEGFMVITGEAGAGKSTLLARLIETADRGLTTVALSCAAIEAGKLVPLVAHNLGVSTLAEDREALLEALERRLEGELRAGKHTLLVVDDAHDLSVTALAELHMLSTCQIGGRALVQVLLLGRAALGERLEASGLEALRRRIIMRHHLDGLTRDEVDAYLHRCCKGQELQLFGPAICERLHAQSGGLPGRLDTLAEQLTTEPTVAPAEPHGAQVLHLRSSCVAAVQDTAPEPVDSAHEIRFAGLEARLDAQEAVLRRIISLIAD